MKSHILIFVALLLLACGVPAAITPMFTPTPESVRTPVQYSQKPTEVPQRRGIVTASETVWIRQEPNPGALRLGYLENGAEVTVFECVVSWDMGVWARVEGGYVNSKFLEKGVCE